MIKISSEVDETAWRDLESVADESSQQISELLTQPIKEYVQRRRIHSTVLDVLNESMQENNGLGKLFSK